MSKIALIASDQRAVDRWRTQSGILPELAPWITSALQADEHAPFVSVLLLSGWDRNLTNAGLRNYILAGIAGARPAPSSSARPSSATPNHDASTPDAGSTRSQSEIEEEDRLMAEDLANDRAVRGSSPEAEHSFPLAPPLTEQDRLLREFGVNPALIGMISDQERNGLCDAIRDTGERGTASFLRTRSVIVSMGYAYRIAPWVAPRVSASPVEVSADAPQRRAALVADIERYMGDTYQNDYLNMTDDQLARCAQQARLALELRRMDSQSARDALRACHTAINEVLAESRRDYLAAGFEPATYPTQDRPVPVAPQPAPVRRPYVDPLRDHLSSYMRDARHSEEHERERRRQRTRERNEEMLRRARDEARRSDPGIIPFDEPDDE